MALRGCTSLAIVPRRTADPLVSYRVAMVDAGGNAGHEPRRGDAGGPVRRPRLAFSLIAIAVAASLVAVAANALGPGRSPGQAVASVVEPSRQAETSTSPAPSDLSSATGPRASGSAGEASPGRATPPLLAAIDENGGLSTMDDRGASAISYVVPGVTFGFPAWSPDGSHIAAIGYRPEDASIYVFAVPDGGTGTGTATDPVVIYRSLAHPPFYLYWTPDSRNVGFLANEAVGISLRIAPSDGSAPLDGSAKDAVIRRGSPLYFDWASADRLLLHVGVGSDAFVGEVGRDGAALAPGLPGTGDFRSAVVSGDGRYLAYVRAGTGSPGNIVVATRDLTSQQFVSVYGPAAFAFDPTGDALASIAADTAAGAGLDFPIGPLRISDARTGSVRTLLDGSVIGFFWAPDGRTIAALRLIPIDVPTTGTGPTVAGARLTPGATGRGGGAVVAAATPAPGATVGLAFIDVASGTVRSQRAVHLGGQFVNELLPYFDQYALGHRLWSPDSASLVLPLIDESGRATLVDIPADGGASHQVAAGVSAFWRP